MSVAFTTTPGAKFFSMSGKWPPVSSSCHVPAMNTGTLILSTNVAGAERVVGRHPVGPQLGDLAVHVGALEPEQLVGFAGRVAVGDPLLDPA